MLGPYSFSIDDTTGFGAYTQGGLMTQVLAFLPLVRVQNCAARVRSIMSLRCKGCDAEGRSVWWQKV